MAVQDRIWIFNKLTQVLDEGSLQVIWSTLRISDQDVHGGTLEEKVRKTLEAVEEKDKIDDLIIVLKAIVEDPEKEVLIQEVRREFDNAHDRIKRILKERFPGYINLLGLEEGPSSFLQTVPSPNKFFLGRDEDIDVLKSILGDQKRSLCSMYGIAGIGKTELAIEYANRMGEDDGVIWVDLADKTEDQILLYLGEVLGISNLSKIDGNENKFKILMAVFSRTRVLVVLDNMQKESLLLNIVELLKNQKVIILSRTPIVNLSINHQIELMGLKTNEAIDLFLKIASAKSSKSQIYNNENKEEAGNIATQVGNHPLAIRILGSLFALPHIRSFSNIRNLLKNKGIDAISSAIGSDKSDELTMEKIFKIAIKQIDIEEKGMNGCIDFLLSVCSFQSPVYFLLSDIETTIRGYKNHYLQLYEEDKQPSFIMQFLGLNEADDLPVHREVPPGLAEAQFISSGDKLQNLIHRLEFHGIIRSSERTLVKETTYYLHPLIREHGKKLRKKKVSDQMVKSTIEMASASIEDKLRLPDGTSIMTHYLNLALKTKNMSSYRMILMNLVVRLQQLGDWAKSCVVLDEAISVFQNYPDKNEAMIVAGTLHAYSLLCLGQREKAYTKSDDVKLLLKDIPKFSINPGLLFTLYNIDERVPEINSRQNLTCLRTSVIHNDSDAIVFTVGKLIELGVIDVESLEFMGSIEILKTEQAKSSQYLWKCSIYIAKALLRFNYLELAEKVITQIERDAMKCFNAETIIAWTDLIIVHSFLAKDKMKAKRYLTLRAEYNEKFGIEPTGDQGFMLICG